MRPLKIAVLVKQSRAAYEREMRPMGYWSYAVPEFTWEFMSPGKSFKLDLGKLKAQGYDAVFHEDGGNWGEFYNRTIPVIYLAIDSTLSQDHHFKPRYEQAKQADMVLVEHDDLNRWEGLSALPLRFPYCVNDRVFSGVRELSIGLSSSSQPPRRVLSLPEKTVDISFHNGGGVPYRAKIRGVLHQLSLNYGWTYTSGALPLTQYALAMRASRIVVNWPRNPGNRPHRVLDAMMSGAAVVTGDIPTLINCFPGWHYCIFHDEATLTDQIVTLLANGGAGAKVIAERGAEWALRQTWTVRARQLRALITQELGL